MRHLHLTAALAVVLGPAVAQGQAVAGASLGAYWKLTPLCEGQQDSVKVASEEAQRRGLRPSARQAQDSSTEDSVYVRTDQAAESYLARIYAPTLRFAEDEGYFPTVPFLPAVDGIVNDSASPRLKDLWSPTEIAPLMTLKGQPSGARLPNAPSGREYGDRQPTYWWLVANTSPHRAADTVTGEYADSQYVYWWRVDNSYHSRFADTGVTQVESEALENLVQADEEPARPPVQEDTTDNREYGRRRSVVSSPLSL